MITNAFAFSPNQQYLFGRSYSVSVGAPYKAAAIQYGNIGQKVGPDGSILNAAPLRVKFDIDKNLLGSSNKAKIELYNMSVVSRQYIKVGYNVLLQAGYNGLIRNLFLGNVHPDGLEAKRNGSDIIMSMECGDGESAIANGRLDKSYPPGTTLAQILSDIGNAMSTPTTFNPQGVSAGAVIGIPSVIFNNGWLAHGPCNVLLNTLCKAQGLQWSVQNGNLNIIPYGKNNGRSAIVVSSATGMIGVPSFNGRIMQFISLLNPQIVPGSLVQLVSENITISGFYAVQRAHYEGDSHDNKWQVSCECIPQSGVSQNLPAANGFDFNTAVV
jgi:hypothetical protein